MYPMLAARQRANCLRDNCVISVPSTMMRAAVRPVDAGNQVQQRRLARTAGTHQRNELALLDSSEITDPAV